LGIAEESEEVTSFDSEEQKEETLDLDKTIMHQTKGNFAETKPANPTQTILNDLNRVLGSQTYDAQRHVVRSI